MTGSFTKHKLQASGLEVSRGQRCLFRDLELRLESGHALRITGANGSGKTTLMRVLLGLGFSNAGVVTWDDSDIRDIRDQFHQELHYLGHQTGIKAALTPDENLRFSQKMAGRGEDQNTVQAALKQVGLLAQQYQPCHTLSAGQKQRVALARLLVAPKPLWILDEAFTALDSSACSQFEQQMQDHLTANGMIVFTSHQQHLQSQLTYKELAVDGMAR